MVFTSPFSMSTAFSNINPNLASSGTPQSQEAQKAKAQAQAPKNAIAPEATEPTEYAGAESLGFARTSPLLEAIAPRTSVAPAQPAPNLYQVPQPTFTLPYSALQALQIPESTQGIQQFQRMYPNRLIYV